MLLYLSATLTGLDARNDKNHSTAVSLSFFSKLVKLISGASLYA